MIDHIYNIDTWNIRKQVVEYIMSLKRKRGAKLKAKGCVEGRYHRIFNNVLESSSDLLQSNTHKGCCDECDGIHDLGASGFTCLGEIINPRIFCKNISGFDGIGVTVGISV